MELGEPLLDGEHAAQLNLLDSFERKLRAGEDKEDLLIVLDRLIEFTNLHFMSEEMLMQQHAYPALGLHVKEHDALLEQVRVIQDAFAVDDAQMTDAELTSLRTWLIDHIKTKDQAFVLYLKKRNAETE